MNSFKALLSLFVVLCASLSFAQNQAQQPKNSHQNPELDCNYPYTGQLGTPLKFECTLKGSESKETQHFILSSRQTVKFDRKTLDLRNGETESFNATVVDTKTGLASVIIGEGELEQEINADVGFKGHLKPTETTPLDFRDWRTMQVLLVDRDDKPMSVDLDQFTMEVQS